MGCQSEAGRFWQWQWQCRACLGSAGVSWLEEVGSGACMMRVMKS